MGTYINIIDDLVIIELTLPFKKRNIFDKEKW